MKNLIADICQSSNADIVKMHITLDIDEYMLSDHKIYSYIRSMLFSKEQWTELIGDVRSHGKDVLVLVNDRQALEFVTEQNIHMLEIHASLLGDLNMLQEVNVKIGREVEVILGIGGATLEEVNQAIQLLETNNIVLMFGFQSFPTKYSDINFNKTRNIIQKYPGLKYGYADHTAWDEKNNILISLMGAAIGMDFLEKHVTNCFGIERLDWQSAISLEMCSDISNSIELLNKCAGAGGLELNAAEKSYSVYGPMKKTIVLRKSVNKGDVVSVDDFEYKRTSVVSDIQVGHFLNRSEHTYCENFQNGHVLLAEDVSENSR